MLAHPWREYEITLTTHSTPIVTYGQSSCTMMNSCYGVAPSGIAVERGSSALPGRLPPDTA